MNGMIAIDSERGKELGFTSDRFSPDSYLWEEPERIMISLIFSRTPGNFRYLVRRIHEQGKDVAVPTPLGDMRRIVEKCGYQFALEFDEATDGTCEVWTCSAPAKEGK
jgi:hypothetical protein